MCIVGGDFAIPYILESTNDKYYHHTYRSLENLRQQYKKNT